MDNKSGNPIKLRIASQPDNKTNLYAYVTNDSGKIIETVAFKGADASLTSFKSAASAHNKIYIAQQLPKEMEGKANERMLLKAGAYQVAQNVRDNIINISRIPEGILRPWHLFSCLITGNITNTITVDGQQRTEPLCNARVHLVEVEPHLRLPKIPGPIRYVPDWVIRDLADKLVNLKENLKDLFKPQPIPDPIGPVSSRIEKINFPLRKLGLTGNKEEAMRLKALPTLPEPVYNIMASGSTDLVRQTIAEQHHLLYPYICLFPVFWHWLYEYNEDNIVYTDCNGHFEHWENMLFDSDGRLNIYVWIEAMDINGNWVTVYRPPMPCHTRWNYACGTPINIGLHNEQLAPCHCGHEEVVDGSVWVKRVGSGTSVRRNISLEAAASSLFTDARGLANNVVAGGYVSPFSQSFPVWVLFGNPGSARYYRWKYRKTANPAAGGLSDIAFPSAYAFQQGPLAKTYQYFDSSDNNWHSGQFQLDHAIAGTTLYKIPHLEAKDDVGIGRFYLTLDTASININAMDLQDGLYEFVLELFDSAGNVMHNLPDATFQVDRANTSEESEFARTANPGYIKWGGILSNQVNAFRFVLRVDNNVTSCGIGDAMVLNANGTTATTDTICGFAKYQSEVIPGDPNGKKRPLAGDRMLLRFYAHQQNNFASFDFKVYKGNSGMVFQGQGQVPEPSNTIIVSGSPVSYQYNPALSALLGTCDKAAFSENLYVTAFHTNGSNRITGYDRSAVAAFAVEPQ